MTTEASVACRLRVCLRRAILALLVLHHPAFAATIVVDNTTCNLVDAVTAAETDIATGDCPAGSGTDTIELTSDVTLTSVNNSALFGDSGLPLVTTDIIVEGGGFTIQRGAGAPPFRIFAVDSGGALTLHPRTC